MSHLYSEVAHVFLGRAGAFTAMPSGAATYCDSPACIKKIRTTD